MSTVTGLPASNNFFVDAATVATPETGATLALFIFALALLLGGSISAVALKRPVNYQQITHKCEALPHHH